MGWGRPAEGTGMSRWSLGAALGLGGKIGSYFSQREEGREDSRVGEGQRLSLEETGARGRERKGLSRLWKEREKGREIQERKMKTEGGERARTPQRGQSPQTQG